MTIFGKKIIRTRDINSCKVIRLYWGIKSEEILIINSKYSERFIYPLGGIRGGSPRVISHENLVKLLGNLGIAINSELYGLIRMYNQPKSIIIDPIKYLKFITEAIIAPLISI